MVAPATATVGLAGTVWLNADTVYAKESAADLAKIRASVMDLIEQDEERRGDGSECLFVEVILYTIAY